MKKNVIIICETIIFTIFSIVLCYMLYYHLGSAYLIQTDEAYHATNAYEMYKQGNWIVNTYRYAADYFNSKPPFCLDLMQLSYKAFGISAFAARFPSALAGLLTCMVIVAFFIYKKDHVSAALFPVLFCACRDFFTFHMYRAAEMDGVYNLFFSVAMISLLIMTEHPFFMYIYGLSLGLAFMCKGPHAAVIFVIGVLYIPKIKNAFASVPRVILSALLAAVIPAGWMAKRYMFDGVKLFNALFVGEVSGRVSESKGMTIAPVTDFMTKSVTIVFIIIAVISVINILISKENAKSVYEATKDFLSNNYLYLLWVITPLVLFSVTGSFLYWYTYASQLGMCMLTTTFVSGVVTRTGAEKPYLGVMAVVITFTIALSSIIPCIRDDINLAGTGGHPVDKFTYEMQSFFAEQDKDYSGTNAYLIPAWTVGEPGTGHWEPEYVAPAEMYCDLMPVDGTIDNFLNDPDSILIIDKDMWDEYSYILAGHVILHDDSYLIFSNDMY